MDLDEAIDAAKKNPSKELASRARELFKEVLHISKVSSNMQGKQRGRLKQAALFGTACVEVLRTRADFGLEIDTSTQLQALKERLDDAEREKRRAADKISTLEKTLKEYMTKEGKKRNRVVRRIDSDSETSIGEDTGRKRSRKKSPSRTPKKRPVKKTPSPSSEYGMNVDVEAEDTGTDVLPSSSGVDLPPRELWPPAVRPPLQGRPKILEDVDVSDVRFRIKEKKSPQKTGQTPRGQETKRSTYLKVWSPS